MNPKTVRPARNDSQAKWDIRQAAAARAKARKGRGLKPGLGIELGDRCDGMALCGVDLDECGAARAVRAAAIIDWLKTYGEVRPSGEGVKLCFRAKTEDLPRIRCAMGTEHRKAWKLGDHHGAELQVSTSYFTVTGQAICGHDDGLQLVSWASLLWLVEEAGPVLLNFADDQAAGRDQSGSGHGYNLLVDLVRACIGSLRDSENEENRHVVRPEP